MLKMTNITITNNFVRDVQVVFDGISYFKIYNHKIVILINFTLFREIKYNNNNNDIIYPTFSI